MAADGRIRWTAGLATGLAGALAAVVLGFLTAGVQATAAPRGLPLALTVPDGPAGVALAQRLTAQAGDAVDWRVVDTARARELLAAGEVRGALAVAPGAGITTTTSGAASPAATAVATQVLARAGAGLAVAIGQQTGDAPPVRAEVLRTVAPGAAALPLTATSLLWLAGLAANAALLLVSSRAGRPQPTGAGLAVAGAVAVLGPAVVWGFARLWGLGIAWSAGALGFLALTGLAFALLQGGLLRLLGLPGIGVLALLYLTAPAVAGQAPELLHPAYRVLLWSWTPLRFPTDALRDLLLGAGSAPAVATGFWVLVGLAMLGLAGLILPRRRRRAPAPAPTSAPAAAVTS
jgi:LPXTG-motif cell wall-anchored protein